MEIIGYIAGALTTISFVPQVIHTIKIKDLKSVSLGMYTLFLLGSICWLAYGLVLHSIPMIVANTITACLSSIIFVMKVQSVMSEKAISNEG